MSLRQPVPLMDIHSELSSLLFAARQTFRDLDVGCEVSYNTSTYLNLEIDVFGESSRRKEKVDRIVAQLQQGLLVEEYDYRFRSISHRTSPPHGWEPTRVSAMVDLSHWPHRRPPGWEPRTTAVEASYSASQHPAAPAAPARQGTTR